VRARHRRRCQALRTSLHPIEEIATGIHRFTARHPEWHPGNFGAEVACFAVREPGRTLLIDPLVVDDAGWQALDRVVEGDVEVLITIPYHVRSAAAAARRYRGRVWGHPACRSRLGRTRLHQLSPDRAPDGVRAFAIGRPQRQEMPVLIESRRALCFGDSVVGISGREGPVRVWVWGGASQDWYRDRHLPTLKPLAELGADALLLTHGPPVARGGSEELRRALRRRSWDRDRATR
jgi:hypothetical protein